MARPHPLFWVAAALLLAGALVAATVEDRAPAYALNSGAVYRLEVALAVLVGGYVICSLLGLAFEGRPLQRFEHPGGAAAEASAEPLGQAAGEFATFREETVTQFEDLDRTLADLDARLGAVEDRTRESGV